MRHNNNATRHGVAQEPFMSDSQNIQSVLIENRVFPPSRDFVAGAGLNAERLAALHAQAERSEEHTSELQSLMRISYAVFCLKKKKHTKKNTTIRQHNNTD